MPPNPIQSVGAVAIGRNEAPRLQRCLASIVGRVARVVYVDSGSTDNSVVLARRLGAHVVELDTSQPFTAARARNVGIEALTHLEPGLRYVQVVDGDCELVPGWLELATRRLDTKPRVAVVCGRRRERYPDATVFNRLMDMEWNTPVGEAHACGGDAMLRLDAFHQANGYNPTLICGEEPELCTRLRQLGHRIERLDHDMTRHDANITRFRQWWQRTTRSGWAFAQAAHLHSRTNPQALRRSRSIYLYGLVIPIIITILIHPTRGLSLLALLVYPLLIARVYRHRRRDRHDPPAHAMLYAAFCTLGKIPEALGQLRYTQHKRRGGQATLIEYKHPALNRTGAIP
ncbi:glycosyltransferase family 2 protein [Phycisphaerales bacterium AB-hyl4]|uniref:Glycosyltransferase family 2 protein n=1 Tax=Natronomicrosphaera hydrolytica TaxID=3242702 RepID=A0ABV4U8F3_9BACT